MTDEMMSLRALVEKSADAELLREMVGFAAKRLMELEVEGLTGAEHGQRSPERLNHRNGCRGRDWKTGAGAVELASHDDRPVAGTTRARMKGLRGGKALITIGEVRFDGGKPTSSSAPRQAILGFRSSRHPSW